MAEEYPGDLTELESNFSTEDACRAYLERLRWPRGSAVRVAVVDGRGSLEGCCLSAGAWLPNFGDSRHHLPEHEDLIDVAT